MHLCETGESERNGACELVLAGLPADLWPNQLFRQEGRNEGGRQTGFGELQSGEGSCKTGDGLHLCSIFHVTVDEFDLAPLLPPVSDGMLWSIKRRRRWLRRSLPLVGLWLSNSVAFVPPGWCSSNAAAPAAAASRSTRVAETRTTSTDSSPPSEILVARYWLSSPYFSCAVGE